MTKPPRPRASRNKSSGGRARPTTRGARLLRRYPILEAVPEDDRPAVVRSALRHPLLIGPLVALGLLLLPLYFDLAFAWLGVAGERDPILQLAKMAGTVLVPICVVVPLLSRLVVPVFIRREMRKRGW